MLYLYYCPIFPSTLIGMCEFPLPHPLHVAIVMRSAPAGMSELHRASAGIKSLASRLRQQACPSCICFAMAIFHCSIVCASRHVRAASAASCAFRIRTDHILSLPGLRPVDADKMLTFQPVLRCEPLSAHVYFTIKSEGSHPQYVLTYVLMLQDLSRTMYGQETHPGTGNA